MKGTPFNDKTWKTVGGRRFFKFEQSDYDRGKEISKVADARASHDPDLHVGRKVNREVKLGWMCGMDRDRRIQEPCTNYSTIIRNNCILKRNVKTHLEKALKNLSID